MVFLLILYINTLYDVCMSHIAQELDQTNGKKQKQKQGPASVLAEADPSAAVVTSMVLNVVRLRKQHDAVLDRLASLAADGWRSHTTSGCEASLGAVYTMALMGVEGGTMHML